MRVYVGSARLRTLAAWNQALYRQRKNCCQPDPNSACCKQVEKDQEEINKETVNVICELRPFWDTAEGVKRRLTQLLSTIGLTSAFDDCK